MQRSRITAPVAGLATVLLAGPILAATALAADPTVVVKAGDTLTSLAKHHRTDIQTLVELNRLADPNRIYVGQRLHISVAPPAAATAAPQAAAASRTHIVAAGEHLTRISRRYGVTIAAIVRANGISDPSLIVAGQRLTIPGAAKGTAAVAPAAATAAPQAAAASRTHIVAAGEHLTRISRRYGVTIAAIVRANGISDPSLIFAGQRLTIPGGSATGPSRPPMPAEMAALVSKRDPVRRVIVEEAARYGVPTTFALAVAWQESGWRQSAVSHAGAVGVMQLMPATATWVGEAMLGAPVDIRNTRHNVRAGVRLLAHYLDRYDGDRNRVLAAYYQGQWATDHHGIYAVSRPYIASIKLLERMFGG